MWDYNIAPWHRISFRKQRILEYLEQNLRILSGFYGILRPFDGVIQYRLEMGAKLVGATYQDLYEFWGAELYTELYRTQEPVINLASKEYSKSDRTVFSTQ